MSRFTLSLRTWYAMEVICANGDRHHSPIWVGSVTATGAGDRRLDIEFYHANYPEGVRDKAYSLRVLRRTHGYLLAEEVAKPGHESRLCLLEPITVAWLRRHFPELEISEATDFAVQLDRATARVPSPTRFPPP